MGTGQVGKCLDGEVVSSAGVVMSPLGHVNGSWHCSSFAPFGAITCASPAKSACCVASDHFARKT